LSLKELPAAEKKEPEQAWSDFLNVKKERGEDKKTALSRVPRKENSSLAIHILSLFLSAVPGGC